MITWLHSAEIVGRDDEQRLLLGALDDASDGSGSLVLVSGEAGIGKSALVDNLKQMASERDVRVLWGGCYDLTTTPPYGPWLEALKRYRPDKDRGEPPPLAVIPAKIEQLDERNDFLRDLQRFVLDLATDRPLLIVLEDMHWSDQGSLDALRHLSRHVGEIPAFLIATFRDDGGTARHALAEMLPALVR